MQIFPSLHEGEEGIWCAEITGPDVDQVTCDTSPTRVMYMAADVIRMLTGTCTYEVAEHEYSIETEIGEESEHSIPALECTRCHQKTALQCFDRIDEKIVKIDMEIDPVR